jgi:uncharacterized membrane protein
LSFLRFDAGSIGSLRAFRVDLSGDGMRNDLAAFGPMLPYLFSVVLSRRLVTQRQLGVWIFIAILLAGTAVAGYWYMTDLVHEAGLYGTLELVLAQSCVYLMAAVLCFGRGARAVT